MKTIVTHFSPDLDAIVSVWLVKKYLPGYQEAEITFVPAGETLNGREPDEDASIVHVDTGMGRFDHHQTSARTSATQVVFEFLKEKAYIKNQTQEKAIERLVVQVTDMDHFGQISWPEPDNDRYNLMVDAILDGWRLSFARESLKVVELGFLLVEAIVKQFENKIWAEEILKTDGKVFRSKWGKAVGFETTNDEVVHLAQKKGYQLVVRKDPRKGYVRIKASPLVKRNLTDIYTALVKKDAGATWFLHSSGKMVLNGSTKNPDMKPSKLSLKEIIALVKSI